MLGRHKIEPLTIAILASTTFAHNYIIHFVYGSWWLAPLHPETSLL